MKTHHLMTRLGLSLSMAALLAGCQVQHNRTQYASVATIAKRPSVAAATYFRQAKRAPESQRTPLLIQATDAFLAEGNRRQASSLIRKLARKELSNEQGIQLQLLRAELNLQARHPATAKSILLQASAADFSGSLPLEQQRNRLLIKAYDQLGQKLMAVKTETKLITELAGAEQQATMMTLWEQLSQQPLLQLRQWLVQVSSDSATAGWLQLAIIMREDAVASEDWFQDLARWRESFPNHQASMLIPAGDKVATASTKAPERIALLLPLTGPHAKQGEAVRRGFYAAYFQQRQKLGRQAPAVQVYDTNETPMDTLLQRIGEQGATEIVGPLLKKSLRELVAQPPSGIPVLALNAIDQTAAGVTQFALSPESSIDQLAAGMAAAKKWRVAVLAPDTAMGERLLNKFRSDWTYYRGDIVGVFRYGKSSGYSAGIRGLLNIDQAKARKSKLQRVLGKKLRFVADRRHDIDAFLFIGSKSAAQSLKPLLSFYFSGKLPVYASAQLVRSLKKTKGLADLNGLQFLATPWQVAPISKIPLQIGEIRAQLQQTWPASTQKNGLLYAMGVDAYFILERLPVLRSMPNFSYFGETGMLAVDANQRIFPRLLWTKLSRGKPKLMNRG